MQSPCCINDSPVHTHTHGHTHTDTWILLVPPQIQFLVDAQSMEDIFNVNKM